MTLFELMGRIGLDRTAFSAGLKGAESEAGAFGRKVEDLIPKAVGGGVAKANSQLALLGREFGLLAQQFGVGSGQIGAAIGSIGRLGAGAQFALGAGVFAALGVAAVEAAEKIEQAQFRIRQSTGRTSEALAALEKDFRAVFVAVPAEAGDVAAAISGLAQRLSLSGEPLQGLATQLLNLSRITGTDVAENVRLATQIFSAWAVSTSQQASALDFLKNVSSITGVAVSRLFAEMSGRGGAALREAGFGFQQAAVLLGQMEQKGIPAERVLMALGIAAAKAGQQGREPMEFLAETIRRIKEASESAALAIARDAFGQRGGAVVMVDAVKRLGFDVEETTKKVGALGDTINKAAEQTKGLSQRWQEFKNSLESTVAGPGSLLLRFVEGYLKAQTQFMSFRPGGGRESVSLAVPVLGPTRPGAGLVDIAEAAKQLGVVLEGDVIQKIARLQDLLAAMRAQGEGTFGDQRRVLEEIGKLWDSLAKRPLAAPFLPVAFNLNVEEWTKLAEAMAQDRMALADFNAGMASGRLVTEASTLALELFAHSFDVVLDRTEQFTAQQSVMTMLFDDLKNSATAFLEPWGLAATAAESLASASGDLQPQLDRLARELRDVSENAPDTAEGWDMIARAEANYAEAVRRATEQTEKQSLVTTRLKSLARETARDLADLFVPRIGGGPNAAAQETARRFDILARATNELAGKGFSQPLGALDQFVDKIRRAGSEGEANAIAIRMFGQAGIELVGVIRAGGPEFDSLLRKLHEVYPNTQQASDGFRKLGEAQGVLWKLASLMDQVVRRIAAIGIESALRSPIVIAFFEKMAGWLIRNLDLIGQLIRHIPLIGRALDDFVFGRGGSLGLPSGGIGGVGTIYAQQVTLVAQSVAVAGAGGGVEPGPGPGGPSPVPGPQASGAGGGVAGAIVAGAAGITAGIQAARANNLLSGIEVSTRKAFNELTNLRADSWLRETHMMVKLDSLFDFTWKKLDDVINSVRAGGGVAAAGGVNATFYLDFSGVSSLQAAEQTAESVVRFLELKGVRVRK